MLFRSITKYFEPFAKAEGKSVSLLTLHYYRGSAAASTSTVETLLSYPDSKLKTALSESLAASQASGVPFRIAETNSFSGGGAPDISNSYASALWLIDHTMTCALGGASGVNFHGTTASSTGYTQLVIDNKGIVRTINPEFYGLMLLSLAGSGSMLDTTIAANGLNVSSYAIQSATGGVNVILLNKDATQNLAASITLPQTITTATARVMQGPALDAASNPTIQGASIGVDGSFAPGQPYTLSLSGNSVNANVPSASAVLISVR